MAKHMTGTREDWLTARIELLKMEKDLMRRSDELAQRREALPWVRIDKEYRFETDEGCASLADLFRGRSQLLVYHFMFGYGYRLTDERRGCTGCSLIADHFDGVIPHLNGRDVTLVCESIAPLTELQDYKRQMRWRFPWVSSLGSDFKYDFGAAFTEEQQRNGADYNYQHVHQPEPQKEGMSVFALQNGAVYHTYSTYARGTETLMGVYRFFDLARGAGTRVGSKNHGGVATTSMTRAEPRLDAYGRPCHRTTDCSGRPLFGPPLNRNVSSTQKEIRMKLPTTTQAAISSFLLLASYSAATDSADFLIEMKIIDSGTEIATPRMMIEEGSESSLSISGENSVAVGLVVNSANDNEAHVIVEVESGQNTMSPELLVTKGRWASVSVGELEFLLRVEHLTATK